MSLDAPAPLGPIPEMESEPAKVGRTARRLRTIAHDVAAVQAWAQGRSADGADWSGDAAEASAHASTRFARRLAGPEAALLAAASACDAFEDDLTTLARDRVRLEADRVELNDDIAVALAVAAVALPPPGGFDVAQAQAEVNGLAIRAAVLRDRIATWTAEIAVVERAFVEALAAVDTVGEGAGSVDRVAAQEATGGAVRRALGALVAGGVLPAAALTMSPDRLREYLRDHPDVAGRLVRRSSAAGAERVEALLRDASTGRDAARALFDALRAREAGLLALMYPREVGNLSGAPFDVRAEANAISIVDQLAILREVPPDRGDDTFQEAVAREIALYESILAEDRQVVAYDSTTLGIAELHGSIGPETRNVGVIVPGTFAAIERFQEVADRAESFVVAGDRSLAMISWQVGEFPPGFGQAADSSYADVLAPDLAAFSHDVRQQIEHSGASGDVRTTYLGHSYGGAVVGTAELHGLDADRVLHVASAGMGDGVQTPGDLPASQAKVDRYAMTAPDDFINLVQGAPGGHGADPATFPGLIRLETGDYADGTPIDGLGASHSGVFEGKSDAWRNMLAVLTGEEATTYHSREIDRVSSPFGPGSYPVPDGIAPLVKSERIDIR